VEEFGCWDVGSRFGHTSVDAQHELRIELLDSLASAARVGADSSTLDELHLELIDYASEHFFAEQELMRASRYPGYEEHVEQHNRLLQQVATLQRQLGNGSVALTLEAIQAVRSGLLEHITRADQLLEGFLRGSAVASPAARPRQPEHPSS
jgi:hemerythrin-like metal-binding protein